MASIGRAVLDQERLLSSVLALTGPVRPQLPAPIPHMGSTPAKKLLIIDTDPGIGAPFARPTPFSMHGRSTSRAYVRRSSAFFDVFCVLHRPCPADARTLEQPLI